MTRMKMLPAAIGLLLAHGALAQSTDKIMDHVVVTAPAMAEALVVTTDPKAARQPIPAHDGADLLKNIPGFSVIRKGGTDGDPVFRGMAASRCAGELTCPLSKITPSLTSTRILASCSVVVSARAASTLPLIAASAADTLRTGFAVLSGVPAAWPGWTSPKDKAAMAMRLAVVNPCFMMSLLFETSDDAERVVTATTAAIMPIR